MARIDYLIFGYRRLRVSPSELSEISSVFIRSGISSEIDDEGFITVRERDFDKIQSLLKGRIEFTHSEPMGLYGKWLKSEHKGAIVSSLIISMLITLFFSELVWDIRVSGNENISEKEIIEMLDESGFGIGDVWALSDRSRIESDMLVNNSGLAWISLNRRGTVAYVRVIEKEEGERPPENPATGYSNIVASTDCVIEEITVRRGIAVVKPGDVVKKGDILVVGALPDEAGGGFCYADATVIGRVYDEISVVIERNYQKKHYQGRKLAKISLNFFDFSINIFKIYGNLTKECDIIEDEIEYTHHGKAKLPFSITVSYIPIFDSVDAVYTDEEMIKLASDRLTLLTSDRLSGADLVKIKTDGAFFDDGYKISSRLVLLCEVGENNDFEIN